MNKATMQVVLMAVVFMFLTGCGSVLFKRPTIQSSRTDKITECVTKLLDKGVTAKSSYQVCDGIYGRSE